MQRQSRPVSRPRPAGPLGRPAGLRPVVRSRVRAAERSVPGSEVASVAGWEPVSVPASVAGAGA
jgi:hypothetical protein